MLAGGEIWRQPKKRCLHRPWTGRSAHPTENLCNVGCLQRYGVNNRAKPSRIRTRNPRLSTSSNVISRAA